MNQTSITTTYHLISSAIEIIIVVIVIIICIFQIHASITPLDFHGIRLTLLCFEIRIVHFAKVGIHLQIFLSDRFPGMLECFLEMLSFQFGYWIIVHFDFFTYLKFLLGFETSFSCDRLKNC